MQSARMSLVLAVAVVFAAVPLSAATMTQINGSPLTINVGSDGSFQVFNSAVPGVGQVFPTTATLADMGVFAWIDGELHSPNFRAHGGTATGNLGSYTSWQEVAISSRPSGLGTTASPYNVTVTLQAPGSDVRVSVVVSYVNGNNFFRIRSSFTQTLSHEVDVAVGADIYLGGSDAGIFVIVPELAAVGGRNCDPTEGEYNILLIPITPASHHTTAGYSSVWAQIAAHELDDNTEVGSCIDNGAAIQWTNILQGGAQAATIDMAVSFGEVPSAENFVPFYIRVEPDELELLSGESARLQVTSEHNPTFDFNSPLQFSVENVPQGMTVTLDQDSAPAPGDASFGATVTLDGSVFPRHYRGISIVATGGNERRGATFSVDVKCTPPFILGLYESQPLSQIVPRGSSATLTVKPEGGGLFAYQWYAGVRPMTSSPVAGATEASFVTPAVNEIQTYWVRVTNPCGSADSNTATILPAN